MCRFCREFEAQPGEPRERQTVTESSACRPDASGPGNLSAATTTRPNQEPDRREPGQPLVRGCSGAHTIIGHARVSAKQGAHALATRDGFCSGAGVRRRGADEAVAQQQRSDPDEAGQQRGDEDCEGGLRL